MRRDTAAPLFEQVPFRGMRLFEVACVVGNANSTLCVEGTVCVPGSVLVLGGSFWKLFCKISADLFPKCLKMKPGSSKMHMESC